MGPNVRPVVSLRYAVIADAALNSYRLFGRVADGLGGDLRGFVRACRVLDLPNRRPDLAVEVPASVRSFPSHLHTAPGAALEGGAL